MQKTVHHTTTFQLSKVQHLKLKIACVELGMSMGEFIRMSISKKLDEIKLSRANEKKSYTKK